MGQYFYAVNETKKEVVVPWDIGGTAKFFEWLYNNQARIFVWLLRKSNELGGGDIPNPESYETLGRWAGDKITLIGDYDESKLYNKADKKYQNISKLLYKEYNDAVKKDEFHKEMGL